MWLLERSALSRELVADSEAFLRGALVEQMERRARPVPVWAWTNLLAHGSASELTAERQAPYGGLDTRAERWHSARSYLAEEVSDVAELYVPLGELQRKVLVPLELELASLPEVGYWGPGQWVKTVRERLAQYRRICRRAQVRTDPVLARQGGT